ncbi:MAG: T9SS type A sorting domain-containing protein [Bacteroidetes bacterium]|nr:T9SS type A sorting domain-containing protein [Bacteroidota bacterium]
MKSILTFILVLSGILNGFSQLTITTSDMPSVDDTFRVSNGLITPTIDPALTGTQFTWDFSTLQMVTQDIDSFVNVASTGTFYSVVFSNLPFNPYRANLAAKGPALPAIPQISISDVVYFYYNSTGSYEVSGYGANINGIPVPIPFNNKDRIYDFPLTYGNLDSSDSDFQLSLPGLGFYGHDQHRVNEVDGWGTLITPFGSFNTVRVKSIVTSIDSLYIDSLGTGFGFSLPQTTEYKWLGALSGIPLLQINTTNTLGIEIVSSIRYRDSLRVLTGINENVESNTFSLNVFPNPSDVSFNVETTVMKSQPGTLELYSIEGKSILPLWSGNLKSGINSFEFNADELKITKGVYLLKLSSNSTEQSKLLIIN